MDRAVKTGTIEMIAAMLISGTIGWFVLEAGQSPVTTVFWRCAIGSVALAVICMMSGLLSPRHLSRSILAVAVLGGVAIVLNWLLLFGAYPRATISISTVVYNTQPFMLVALGRLFLGERIPADKVFWLSIAFLGMVAIVFAGPAEAMAASGYGIGIFMALSAAFFYALAAIAAKRLKGTPPQLIALIQVITGTLLLAPLVDWSAPPQTAHAWSLLVAIGVIHTGAMYVLLYGAIQKLPTSLTGALSFLYPVVAVAVDQLVLGHNLTVVQALGSVAILMASAGATLGWRLPLPRALQPKKA